MKKNSSRKVCTQYNFRHVNKLAACCIVLMTSSVISAADKIDWSWSLDHAAIYDSSISIHSKDNQLTQHQFNCNLSDAVSQTLVEDPASTIDTVITSSNPKGLLVVTCNVGAHSETIVIINPNKSTQQVVFRKIGSYFVDWKLSNGQLHISFDRPINNKKADTSENLFFTEKIIWQ